jgi:hypothetical protein
MSIHKEASHPVDWSSITASKQPTEPVRSSHHEQEARQRLETYKPGVADKLFKRAEKKHQQLVAAVDEAKQADDDEYRRELSQYQKELKEWETEQSLATRILAGESEAYMAAIDELNPFSEISDLGSSVQFKTSSNGILDVELNVHGEDVVPKESKSLLQSGKLSVKQMQKGRFYEIYQDYVCSCVLRIANELFSLLPLDAVVVTAVDNMLNSKTGHMEDQPIVSVAIPRATFEALNLDAIDPSDSMQNFVHNMAFKKTKGFSAVERVDAGQLKLAEASSR